MADPNIYCEMNFVIEPLHSISDIIIKKRIPDGIFQDILDSLFEYFSQFKEQRTVNDVDNAIEFVEKKLSLNDLDSIKKELIGEESEKVMDSLENFFKKNIEKIERVGKNQIAKKMLTYWISNIDITLNNFAKAIRMYNAKMRRISRISNRVREVLYKKFEELLKALFLVFFRILEQINMIDKNEVFDVETEINLLISDVVYFENIQRAINESID